MLVNKTAVKQYILKTWATQRPTHEITRVDAAVYITLDRIIKDKIDAVIERHMSRGKTFFID